MVEFKERRPGSGSSMKKKFELLKSPKKVDGALVLSQASLGRYDIRSFKQDRPASFHPDVFTIGLDEIHTWTFSLDQPEEIVAYFTSLLSQDELSRAARLRSESAWKRFTTGRGWLRLILSQYVEQTPEDLCFSYGLSGKPQLQKTFIHQATSKPPFFNLAHSNGTGMLAVTCSGSVGIDLEFIHPIPEIETIASRYFSPREWAALAALPDKDKINGFFNTWTCKEAFVKALGEGFALPFNTFTISISPQGRPASIELEGSALQEPGKEPDRHQNWLYLPVQPPHGFAAAMVIEKPSSFNGREPGAEL